MGATLVNRQTLPLSLTPAGEVFVELCARVTRDVRDTHERVKHLESEASARISVGSTQGLFSHFYRTWAHQAGVAERLQLNLKATNWVGEQFLDALDNGDCDLVTVLLASRPALARSAQQQCLPLLDFCQRRR